MIHHEDQRASIRNGGSINGFDAPKKKPHGDAHNRVNHAPQKSPLTIKDHIAKPQNFHIGFHKSINFLEIISKIIVTVKQAVFDREKFDYFDKIAVKDRLLNCQPGILETVFS